MNAKFKPLRDALRARQMNIKRLCNIARVQYTHFSAIGRGARPGRFTWPKIAEHLNDHEIAIVNESFGNVIPQ